MMMSFLPRVFRTNQRVYLKILFRRAWLEDFKKVNKEFNYG